MLYKYTIHLQLGSYQQGSRQEYQYNVKYVYLQSPAVTSNYCSQAVVRQFADKLKLAFFPKIPYLRFHLTCSLQFHHLAFSLEITE